MQDKPLDRAERDLLTILLRLDAERGPISREVLSVEARGRGLEFGRSFARLKTLGLIEELERRPFFVFRLFGARSVQVLRLTQDGRLAGAEVPDPSAPLVPADHGAEDAPASPPDVAEATVADQASAVLPAAAPVAEAVPEAVTPADLTPEPPQLAASAPPADLPPQDAPQPAAEGPSGPGPVEEPAQPQPAAPKPKASATPPRRFALTAFTEVLGGAPMAPDTLPARPQADPEVLQSLRDILGGLGIDLTMAGEMLVADRMAKGATAGEALSQVVVFAFAHVVHHDLMHGRQIEALGLGGYAVEVMRELQKLHDAGEIGAQAFDADMTRIQTLIDDAEGRAALAEALLADPFGGAAPPAVLPEELRQASDD